MIYPSTAPFFSLLWEGGWKWGGRGLNVIDKEQASVHLWKASAVLDEEQKDVKELRAKCCS